MATMSKKVTEGKSEHTRLTEYVSHISVLEQIDVQVYGKNLMQVICVKDMVIV